MLIGWLVFNNKFGAIVFTFYIMQNSLAVRLKEILNMVNEAATYV